MRESSFFHAFTDDELERAAQHASIDKYPPGQIVYDSGDAPSAFFVIAVGSVVRDYRDGSEARVIPAGSYFGEMGVLLPRTMNLARVTTVESCALLRITKVDWPKVQRLLQPNEVRLARFASPSCCSCFPASRWCRLICRVHMQNAPKGCCALTRRR